MGKGLPSSDNSVHTELSLPNSNQQPPTWTAERKSADTRGRLAFFTKVTAQEAADQVNAEFARLRAEQVKRRRSSRWKRNKLHRDEATIGFLTVNTSGLASGPERADQLFSWLKVRSEVGAHDLTFLQETHVELDRCHELATAHCRVWGYDPARTRDVFSWWSGSQGLRGGLGILLRPGSTVQNVRPFRREDWSEHLMAVMADVHGVATLLLNVYAPHEPKHREAFYATVERLRFIHDGPTLFGGDFNCTLYPRLDRTLDRTAGSHDSLALRGLLAQLNAVDVLRPELADDDEEAVETFRTRLHTYSYNVGDTTHSSRLDRWYISIGHAKWVRHVQVVIPGASTDHSAVALRVAAPHMRVFVRKQRKVYPVRSCARRIAQQQTDALFATLTTELEALDSSELALPERTRQMAEWWDESKLRFVKMYTAASREGSAKLKTSYRKRISRLQAELLISDNTASRQDSTRIRNEIMKCKADWAAARTKRVLTAHTELPTRTSKQFYARIATNYADNTIVTLGPGTAGSGRRLANAMAAGWTPIMQQRQAPDIDVQLYLDNTQTARLSDHLVHLDDRISEAEVAQAVKRCKRHKARGPDNLPNDWYRDHCTDLVPILLTLFRRFHEAGLVPRSFGQAHVQALKKHPSAATPLEHRPIALLNTDYKIYTRIFAVRMRPLLPEVVHNLQAGFVPQRSIHSAIDLLHAAQRLAAGQQYHGKQGAHPAKRAESGKTDVTETLNDAVAVLADFAKAYDSVNRRFLLAALDRQGFPPAFLSTVKALHARTECTFLVNGYQSRRIQVTCGIRQGCPLAPLLFIVMLDVLYRRVETDTALRGVPIITEGGRTDVRVSGYADDTALYLESRSQVPAALTLLHDFGAVSGLRVNVDKSVVLPLGHAAIARPEPCGGMKVLGRDETCRYLGIRVGATDVRAANWDGVVAALQTRLRHAFDKTHSVTQRAEIARAVIVPKILFLARHSWPTSDTVDALQSFTSSFVWGTRAGKKKKAWLSPEQAELPTKMGGIALPQIRCELLTLAATTAARWASNATDLERAIGDILISAKGGGLVYVTPHRERNRTLRLGQTLWRTGVQALASAHWQEQDPQETARIAATAAALNQVHLRSEWSGGTYNINIGSDLIRVLARHAQQATLLRGAFCSSWLEHASTTRDGWLLNSDGSIYALSRQHLAAGTVTLSDILQWRLVERGRVSFTYIPGHHSATAPTKRAFQRLCYTLMYNFPHILLLQSDKGWLRPYSSSIQLHHSWRVDDGTSIKHYDATLLKARHRVIRATASDQAATTDVAGVEQVEFLANPRTSRLVQPWCGSRRWVVKRQRYYAHVAEARRRKGEAARDAAAANVGTGAIAGVTKLNWNNIKRLKGLNTYERQTIYRIRAGKFSCWNPKTASRTCPMPGCGERATTIQHIFWECAYSQRLWSTLSRQWRALGLRLAGTDAQAFFSLKIPGPPRRAWTLLTESHGGLRTTPALQDQVYPAASILWQYSCGATLAAIWRARVEHLHDEAPSNLTALYHAWRHRIKGGAMLLRGTPDEGQVDDGEARLVARKLAQLFLPDKTGERSIVEPATSGAEYALFFDGGSRGNPGPGGSGSIITQVNPHLRQAHIRWVASMAYSAADTTNNLAEYMGLLHGLRHARSRDLQPLHVVGDSDMIMRQMREHRAPRNRRLRAIFLQATRLSDTMDVRSWTHHYRANNKMADLAANQAMDSKVSAQYPFPTLRAAGEELQQWLDNDMLHWFDQRSTWNDRSLAC